MGYFGGYLSLSIFRSVAFARDLSVGDSRLRTLAWELSLGNVTWELSLGNIRLGLSLGTAELPFEKHFLQQLQEAPVRNRNG